MCKLLTTKIHKNKHLISQWFPKTLQKRLQETRPRSGLKF